MEQPVSVAPLVTFRLGFGLVMLLSTIRYMALGWVDAQLIAPLLHFSYFGFEWVQPLPGKWLYLPFFLMVAACIGIILGWYYRFFSILFFLCFTYIELIDITYYLNHYYFVSIVAFMMIWVPANRYFSLDVVRKPQLCQEKISLWCIGIFKLQIAIVYCYAGLAKINYDWLIKAFPLAIWLPAKTSIPVIGWIFKYKLTAYLFSWMGMFFDTLIIGGLLWKKTRWFAYLAVIIFHTLTGILFQIGVFPIVMIFAVIIFFSDSFHERLLGRLSTLFKKWRHLTTNVVYREIPIPSFKASRIAICFFSVFFLFQFVFPWRYLLYNGNIFWTEEGYRFSWRVMLMEKAGTATFYVRDGHDGREGSVINHQFLNPHQEKQMAMQPDLILQFAHYLRDHFMFNGMEDPKIRAEVWVTLNARPAKLLIDPQVDLTEKTDTWKSKDWILPYGND
ncbi:MAG: HTTM domain-containing protein [Bacteroidota bacterium]